MDCSNLRYETERLALVSMEPKYREAVFANFRPEVTTYMYPRAAEEIAETDLFIASALERNHNGIDWVVAVTLKETGEYLGGAGVHNIRTSIPELGIWIKMGAHGHGYGLEAVGGLIEWARANLTFEYLKYPVDRRNIASSRIPEHFGGTIQDAYKMVNQNGVELDLVEYRIL